MSAVYTVSWQHEDGNRQTSYLSGHNAGLEAVQRASELSKDEKNLPVYVDKTERIVSFTTTPAQDRENTDKFLRGEIALEWEL